MNKLVKKLTLFTLLVGITAPAHAGWVPGWLSNVLPSFTSKSTTLYLGAGLIASSLMLGGYLWYKYGSVKKPLQKPTSTTITQATEEPTVTESHELSYFQPQTENYPLFIESFALWHNICTSLQPYQFPSLESSDAKTNYSDPSNNQRAVSAQDLDAALETYFETLQKDPLFTDSHHWIHEERTENLFDALHAEHPNQFFDPYVQKVALDANAVVAFHGDIHGDIHSLVAFLNKLHENGYLENFKITQPNFYMVFLGDYTDRGWYGAEVIYTILQLKCANPSHVFLVRGNHEDINQNNPRAVSLSNANNFYAQLHAKYSHDAAALFTKIHKMYETLPLALYLGSGNETHKDFILCCHGGIELGFNPENLLSHPESIAFTKLGALDRWTQLHKLDQPELMKFFKNINTRIKTFGDLKENIIGKNGGLPFNPYLKKFTPEDIITLVEHPFNPRAHVALEIGFQWNDYAVDSYYESDLFAPWFVKNNPGRGLILGKTFNRAVLAIQSTNNNIVHGVFRAHQHSANPENEMMQSILKTDGADDISNKGVSKLWPEQKDHEHHENPYLLWDNIICTFNVCPHTPYKMAGIDFDTYGLLHLAENYNEWRLEVVQIPMFTE